MRKDDKIDEIRERLKSLPEGIQQAVLWLVTHMDFAEQMCNAEPITGKEMRCMITHAKEKEDDLLLVLLLYKQLLDEQASEGHMKQS